MSGKDERPIKVIERYENDGFIITLEQVIEDPAILEYMYLLTEQAYTNIIDRGEIRPRRLHVQYNPTMDGRYNFVSKHAEAWYLYYVRGYNMYEVASELAHFQPNGVLLGVTIVNNYVNGGWRAIYQEEILGEIVVMAIKERLYPSGTILNTRGMPDIFISENDTWVEVKCRNRLRPRYPIELYITENQRNHISADKPVKIVRLGYAPGNARIEVWDISSN